MGLRITTKVDAKVLDFLKSYTVGSKEEFSYQHCDVTEKIKSIKRLLVFYLEYKNRILGTCVLCGRDIFLNKEEHFTYYIRYFSIHSAFQRKGNNISASFSSSNSIIKQRFEDFLNTQKPLDGPEPYLFYAYVDLNNHRSRSMCNRLGFEKIREFNVLLFSRLFPKKNRFITHPDDQNEIRKLLLDFYNQYNFFSFENFDINNYYIIKDREGRVVAGAHVRKEHWKILNLPSFSGKLISFFKYLPLLNNLYNDDYYFLTFDFIYYKDGYQDKLSSLFEGLLYKEQVNSSILCLDKHSDLYNQLKRQLNFGILNKLNKEITNDIVIKSKGISNEKMGSFRKCNAFISPYDTT